MSGTARIRITRVLNDSALGNQIEPKMAALGEAVGARMQRLVPKRTWALHDSISSSTVLNGVKVMTTVGFGSKDVGYGLAVERGTKKMEAQAFARPAFAQTTGRDLKYSGGGIISHGLVAFSTRRDRIKKRGK